MKKFDWSLNPETKNTVAILCKTAAVITYSWQFSEMVEVFFA